MQPEADYVGQFNSLCSYFPEMTEIQLSHNYYEVAKDWDLVSVKERMPYLQKLNDRIFELDGRVQKVRAAMNDSTSHILFCNSEGKIYYDYRPMCSLAAFCIMEENGLLEYSYATLEQRLCAEFLKDELF